tara:strand:- start:36 stop:317 length:282 start_codon:yes stop_codon:yes gene_type:complete
MTVKALKKKNNMKKAPFKLKSGNKPSIAKMAGVSPMKDRPTTTKEKIKAIGGTAADIFTSTMPITAMTNIKKTYRDNKAYQRFLSDKKKKEKK